MLCVRLVLLTITNLSSPGVPSVDVDVETFLLSTARHVTVSDFHHSFSHGL